MFVELFMDTPAQQHPTGKATLRSYSGFVCWAQLSRLCL